MQVNEIFLGLRMKCPQKECLEPKITAHVCMLSTTMLSSVISCIKKYASKMTSFKSLFLDVLTIYSRKDENPFFSIYF